MTTENDNINKKSVIALKLSMVFGALDVLMGIISIYRILIYSNRIGTTDSPISGQTILHLFHKSGFLLLEIITALAFSVFSVYLLSMYLNKKAIKNQALIAFFLRLAFFIWIIIFNYPDAWRYLLEKITPFFMICFSLCQMAMYFLIFKFGTTLEDVKQFIKKTGSK